MMLLFDQEDHDALQYVLQKLLRSSLVLAAAGKNFCKGLNF
jgi:predicted MarR family transcription regulator